MEKTTKEWFQELEEPYRTLALENLKEECEDVFTTSISQALSCGFAWRNTTQGYEYWNRLFNEL